MKLKQFLKLIPENELIRIEKDSVRSPLGTKQDLFFKKYLDCTVVGIFSCPCISNKADTDSYVNIEIQ